MSQITPTEEVQTANMSPKASTKQDTKTALLETGTDVMIEKGYSNTGIQEVLSRIGVPKGSFYHYFDSKEDFALQIIAHCDQSYTANLLRTLRNQDASPIERLRNYCEANKEKLVSNECRKGCLIGNLSQEMADQSETLRTALSHVMGKWRDLFASCIEEGQNRGEIKKTFAPHQMAELFLSGWEGAIMRSKTTKCVEPLDTFIALMFNDILKV
jgi:TetR/AcrR family transcriptional regulator, transcriptional repressor for nem operon